MSSPATQSDHLAPRILLIDDEPDFLLTLSENLKLSGYETETASNSREALAKQDLFVPDIALIDVRLGQDNGLDLVADLHRKNPQLVCVMVTAYHDIDSAIGALHSGAYDYLRKPFRHGELTAVLRRCEDKVTITRENLSANRALRQSEERFRQMFHTAPDAMALIRAETLQIVDVNQRAIDTFGYERNQVIGSMYDELDLWVDMESREALFRALVEFGMVNNLQADLKTADGSIIPCLVSGNSIVIDDKMHYILGARDISEIRRASEALAESEKGYRALSQQFETLLDGITDTLLLVSKEGVVIWGNRAASTLFDLPVTTLPGLSCRQLWRREYETCAGALQQVLQTGAPGELAWETVNGRYWALRSFPIAKRTGDIESVIQIVSDITEKRQLREEAARQSHLAALGELSAGVAHEINNPTGTIIRSMTLLKDAFVAALPILDEYHQEHGDFDFGGIPYSSMREQVAILTGDIQDGANRIKRIVEDLKDFSRPHDGSEKVSFDLGAAAEKSVRLIAGFINKHTDHFELDVASDLPPCIGSSQRVEQVILNLVQNACQALQDRSRSVRLSVVFAPERQMNIIRVEDEGRGIDPEILTHIQEPFFTTRRDDGGTGLGLSVTTRIIHELGGELSIQSEPGKGSVFSVFLPVAAEGE